MTNGAEGNKLYFTYVIDHPGGDQWIKQDDISKHEGREALEKYIDKLKISKHGKKTLKIFGVFTYRDTNHCVYTLAIENRKREQKWGFKN